MYVVGTCGAFVVGVQFTVVGVTLNDIQKVFREKCKATFALRDDEVADVKVENVCDTDPVVTALSFMDKYTDECSKVIRKKLTLALSDSIADVYSAMYLQEMCSKVQKLHEQLYGTDNRS